MADRLQYQAPSMLTSTAPNVQVDTGAAEFLKTTSAVFLNNANEAHKRQLGADLEQARIDGEKIGYKNGEQFRPMKSQSLFARQFNQSGVQMASEKVSINSQKTIKKINASNFANPEGVASQLEAYKDGMIGELPDEMATIFERNFDVLGSAAVEKANAERRDLDGQEAAANFYTYDREVTNTAETLAPLTFKSGLEGDKARAAIATLRQNYVESLAGNGPDGEYDVGGYKVKSAPGRSGAFSPLEIQKKITAFDNMVIAAGVLGNFQEEAKNGRATDAYMSFVKGDMEISTLAADGNAPAGIDPISLDDPVQSGFNGKPPSPDQGGLEAAAGVNQPDASTMTAPAKPSYSVAGVKSRRISDILTNDEMEEVAGKMRSFIGGMNAIEEGEYRKFERNREFANDDFLRTGYAAALEVVDDGNGNKRVIGGDPIALQNVIAQAALNPLIKPETIDKLQTLAKDLGTGQIDNPITVGTLWQGISTGEINSYKSLPSSGVSDATKLKMYDAIDQRMKGQHWTNSTRYGIAKDYADAVLAPEKSAGFSLMGDPNSASAADRAEWNKRMIEESLAAESKGLIPKNPNAMPIDKEFDFVKRGKEIADEIAQKRKAPTDPATVEIDNEIKAVEDQMNAPKKGDDVEAIKKRYRELQDRKNQLQTRALMGAQ